MDVSSVKAYLLGLQVTFANLGTANLNGTYKIEVIADDRLRDAGTGAFTMPAAPVANGGDKNQQTNLPAVLNTDTFNPCIFDTNDSLTIVIDCQNFTLDNIAHLYGFNAIECL